MWRFLCFYYPTFCSVQALIRQLADQDAHLTSESERFVVPSTIRQLTDGGLGGRIITLCRLRDIEPSCPQTPSEKLYP